MQVMRVDKALRDVMAASKVSMYRLSTATGIDIGTIAKIVKGKQSPTWAMTERIANGLGTIHPRWRHTFIGNLSLDEDAFEDTPIELIIEEALPTFRQAWRILAAIKKVGGIEGLQTLASKPNLDIPTEEALVLLVTDQVIKENQAKANRKAKDEAF